MEGKDNEIQNLSPQKNEFINQLTNTNEEIMNLRLENERLQNDLNSKRQLNERMMKSQADMNQLNEKNIYRQKGKSRIGYKEEGESSKQGAQKNQRPTCNHCGKIGHTSNKFGPMGKKNSMESATIAINIVIRLMNAKRNQYLKENVTSVSHQNAKPMY